MDLEQILQKYFGLKGNAFNVEGRFTRAGAKAYKLLVNMICDLSMITDTFDPGRVIRDLDRIEYE